MRFNLKFLNYSQPQLNSVRICLPFIDHLFLMKLGHQLLIKEQQKCIPDKVTCLAAGEKCREDMSFRHVACQKYQSCNLNIENRKDTHLQSMALP